MTKKLALIFPGQGSQYVGMGKDFYDNFEEAREVFDKADEILGYSLSDIIFEDPNKELTLTKNSQPAIFVMSLALMAVFKKYFKGLNPFAVAGLSLGEYSALVAGGFLSFEEGLKIVAARGAFMHEASEKNPGSLSAVLGMEAEAVQKVLDEQNKKVWIANLNCPGQVVISGSLEDLGDVSEALKQSGARRVVPLDVSGAFHSGLMNEAKEKLTPYIKNAHFQDSDVKLVMNVSGGFEVDSERLRENLIRQVSEPTLWEKGIRALEESQVDLYIEIGPGKSLAGMNKKIKVSSETLSLEKISDLETLKSKLSINA